MRIQSLAAFRLFTAATLAILLLPAMATQAWATEVKIPLDLKTPGVQAEHAVQRSLWYAKRHLRLPWGRSASARSMSRRPSTCR